MIEARHASVGAGHRQRVLRSSAGVRNVTITNKITFNNTFVRFSLLQIWMHCLYHNHDLKACKMCLVNGSLPGFTDKLRRSHGYATIPSSSHFLQ